VLDLPQKGEPASPSQGELADQEVAEEASAGRHAEPREASEPYPVLPAPAGDPVPEVSSGGESDLPDVDQPEVERPRKPVLSLPTGLSIAASFASGLLTAHMLGKLRGGPAACRSFASGLLSAQLIAKLRDRRARLLSSPEKSATPEPGIVTDIRLAGASPGAASLLRSLWTPWRERGANASISGHPILPGC
jgi:hypothetical protein